MTLITFSDGKVVMRDDKVGTEQACCCGQCLCGPINLTVNFSVDEYDFSWDVATEQSPSGVWFDYKLFVPNAEMELPCDSFDHETTVQGCAICTNGKYRIAVGVVMESTFQSGDCVYWDSANGTLQNIFHQRAKLHVFEVNACDCTDVTDLGVQDFVWLDDHKDGFAAATPCSALDGLMQIVDECGEVCLVNGQVENIPPEECPGEVGVAPLRSIEEGCDPDDYVISGASVECANEFP